MGLLDGLLGSVLGGGNANSNNPLMGIAMQLLQNGLQGNGGRQGGTGLDQIVGAFKQGGLGHLADSWVGTGENLPVSSEQISQVLGSGKISEIASQLGLSQTDVAGGLSQLLPQLIDKVTPNGQAPASGDLLQAALSMFLKK